MGDREIRSVSGRVGISTAMCPSRLGKHIIYKLERSIVEFLLEVFNNKENCYFPFDVADRKSVV